MNYINEAFKRIHKLDKRVDALEGQNTNSSDSGGDTGDVISIPDTAYDNNDDAVAALGVGVLYKSTTLINGSPIILITA